MSKHTNSVADPFKTSGSSPPNGGGSGSGSAKKSQMEVRAEEEFKSACKVMSAARQRRDALKKRREDRELREKLQGVIAENARLMARVSEYQEAQSDLFREVDQLKTELEAARSDREKLVDEQKEMAWTANRMLEERDGVIRKLRLALEIVENAVGEVASTNECVQVLTDEPDRTDH